MDSMKVNRLLLQVLKYLFLILVLIFVMIPILYTISASFKTNAEIMAHPENFFPAEPTLENYRIAWSGQDFNIPRMFWNSVVYTFSA